MNRDVNTGDVNAGDSPLEEYGYEWGTQCSFICTDRGRHKRTELALIDGDGNPAAFRVRQLPSGGTREARRDGAIRQRSPNGWRTARAAPSFTRGGRRGEPVTLPNGRTGTRGNGMEFQCPRCGRTMRYTADRLCQLMAKIGAHEIRELDLSILE